MKRFVVALSCLLAAGFVLFLLLFAGGFSLRHRENTPPHLTARTQGKQFQLCSADGWTDFSIRGVDLGSGIPGAWPSEHKIDQDTYLRWFEMIRQMGANVIRVYGIQSTSFYQALSAFNAAAATPLYLIQGVWVDDQVQNTPIDVCAAKYRLRLLEECRTTVDVLHGRRFLLKDPTVGNCGLFSYDVSDWVIGYVIGSEWADLAVAYTDQSHLDMPAYTGDYLYSQPGATAFETLLAEAGDQLIAYESRKYAAQKPLSFANSRSTDPFTYPDDITEFFSKCAAIDTEHIRPAEKYQSGLFASYSVYAYDMDYLSLMPPEQWDTLVQTPAALQDCNGTNGSTNTYLAYLKLLNAHHTMPVVVIAFGGSSSRGMVQQNSATNCRNGHMSESEQSAELVKCYRDIAASGCAGACIFSWQDAWSKRIWNTMYACDLNRSIYWSDAQTCSQHFGLLAFDPGQISTCIVDGDVSEWSVHDVVKQYPDGSSISIRYDEGYLYLRVYRPGYQFGQDTLYIPIDTTPKTGSLRCFSPAVAFDKPADFLLCIHGTADSALLVQDRYHAIHANYEQELTGTDAYIAPPARDSAVFEVAAIAVKDSAEQFRNAFTGLDRFETGHLRYGTADPDSAAYDSLADFMACGENLELRLPWAMLNFADPSRMQIHDDYYDGSYGVRFISLRQISVGLGTADRTIEMGTHSLQGWKNRPTWHERLKPAYYAMQKVWTNGGVS